MTHALSVLDIVKAARTQLFERGLYKHKYVDPDEGQKCCMLGALRLATGGRVIQGEFGGYYLVWDSDDETGNFITAIFACEKALTELHPDFGQLSRYNDSMSTTTDDAIAVFDRAIHNLTKD